MTADEVLKQMQIAAALRSENPVCVIDAQSRTITVPEQYKLFGVENDKRVERVYFQCPKIVGDNQDLSQGYQLFINYQNANGDPDAYHIDDMSVEEDNITFSWLLEENVTKYKGSIKFAFGAIKPGDELLDPDKNRWNTTINTDCTCLIGLKSTQQVAESNPDALAQIWAAIDELKAGGGGGGTPGKDGREIELQNNGTAIQWRYVGDLDWTDLVQLSDLKGEGIPEGGTTGQVLTKNSDSDGDASWKNPSAVSDEQVKTAVDNYLEENPVQGGITEEQEQQLEQNTQDITDLKNVKVNKGGWAPNKYLGTDSGGNIIEKDAPTDSGGSIDPSSQNLINPSEYQNSGYSGTLYDEFGTSTNVFNSEIDVSENKILYYRVYRNNQVYSNVVSLKVACYDLNGAFLFLMNDGAGNYTENFESVSTQKGTTSDPLETVNGNKVVVKGIGIINIPENAKKVKFGISGNSNMIPDFYPAFAVSYSAITNYGSISDGDYALTQGESNGGGSEDGSNLSKPLLNKTFLMIGDSLTNWGGGGDTSDGFLKIIHDRTGVNTVNQGLAGATWEEADGQTQPGVTRVDTYVSGSVRYDCIGFLLGTNVSNQGNTTDTSSTKTTMCGAIKYCLKKLIALSPTTPIIVFLPPQRAEGNAEQKSRNDMIKQICETYGVYTFDLYTRSQVIPNTTVEDNGTLLDGLHLSEKGQQNFGRIMSSAILNVMGY